MKNIKFTWDENKNSLNKKKHGVSFEEAETVFYDENAIEYDDPDHSEKEERFLMLGVSHKLRTLVICHCLREEGTVIRIISARKATKKEQANYEEGFQ